MTMTLIIHLQPASEFLSLIGWGSNYTLLFFFFFFAASCCTDLSRPLKEPLCVL